MLLLALGLGMVGPVAATAAQGPSEAAARELEARIAAIEEAQSSARMTRSTATASEVEIESYILYGMQDEIPVRLDSVDLGIRPGAFEARVEMFVDKDLSSTHSIVGPLFEGAHSVFFEGAIEAHAGLGTFDLQGVRVDGVPVPVFLVKALLSSLDEPVDLDAPFDLPLGIEEFVLLERSVRATY